MDETCRCGTDLRTLAVGFVYCSHCDKGEGHDVVPPELCTRCTRYHKSERST